MQGLVSCSLLLSALLSIQLPVSGDPNPNPQGFTRPEQELLTKYLLKRLLGKDDLNFPGEGQDASDRSDRDQLSSSSIIYPQVSSQNIQQPLRILLDQAKENIDVIDFRKNRREQYFEDHIRTPRQPQSEPQDIRTNERSSSPSEAIPTFLPFPGTEPPAKTSRKENKCADCLGEGATITSRFSMPLTQLGPKKYYLGIFFKANWYKAEQYCRFHGMHLASINKEAEQNDLENHIESFGMGHEHFWTSGTDQGEEGKFFWMSTGKPVTYENWNAGEPNNFTYENGEEEHCLELWNRDGKGLRWNDTPCSFETFFVCEV